MELAAPAVKGDFKMLTLARIATKAPGNFGLASHSKKLTSVLMAGVMTGVVGTAFVGASVEEASAQGFFERLFNPEKARMRELRARKDLARKKAVRVRVSAPKYFTYKPDAWKSVSLSELAKVKTAAVATTDETVPASQDAAINTAAPILTEFDKARPALKTLKFAMLPEVEDAIKTHYRDSPNFLWSEDGNVNSSALGAIKALTEADREGLDPADYKVSRLFHEAGTSGGTIAASAEERAAAIMAFEIELSSAVLTYVLDATRGRVNPNRLSGYHDLPRHKVDLVKLLQEVRVTKNLEDLLIAQNPQSSHYKALKKELAALRAVDEADDRIEIAPGTFLKAGKSSPEMKNIVAAVVKNGSDTLRQKHADVLAAYAGEELYSPELVSLVKDFQKENKLSVDGVVGKNTITAMVGVTNASKVAKLELAMERSRWLPEELGGRRVFINQPAYTATYYAPGEIPLSMRVVVGKKSNQTNFFYDTIEVVEYNPYWGVPYSIIVNEMIPKLSRDPSYLDRAGYEVTTPSGRKISSASVDWYSVAAKQSSVNVRQYPGRSNALGEVKILFPNKHHIYMHDTPSKSLFKKDARAFSHGCVRLQDPKAMAAAVLGKSKDYVTNQISVGQNRQEKVEGDIPVYVSYFTAWPEQDGSISYFTDVYDRDRFLLKALDATDKSRSKART